MVNRRRNYWCHLNGVDTSETNLRFDGEVFTVPTGQPFTLEELEAIPEEDILAWESANQKVDKFKIFQAAIQKYLDDTARLSGYDSIVNACGYAAAPNPFQAESLAFVVWRGNVWAYSYQMLEDVESGARTEPTIDEVINELPKFNQGQ